MVGYKPDETLTPQQKLVAGCLAGVTTRFVTQPMDVVKLRTQLLRSKKSSSLSTFRTIRNTLKEEGITAFWHGHVLGQIHSVLAVSSQFYIYELTTRSLAQTRIESKYRVLLTFLCGIFAGCCSATLVIPLEVIRVRQMIVHDQYKGLVNGARAVYKYGGMAAFYEGWTASVLQMGPQVGISLGVFNFLQPILLSYFDKQSSGKHRPENVILASTVSGSTAGFVSKTLTYPFDLSKRRLQIGSHKKSKRFVPPKTTKHLIKCQSLSECISKAYRMEGLPGLFRGWSVTVTKAQVTSIMAYTSYELICHMWRDIV